MLWFVNRGKREKKEIKSREIGFVRSKADPGWEVMLKSMPQLFEGWINRYPVGKCYQKPQVTVIYPVDSVTYLSRNIQGRARFSKARKPGHSKISNLANTELFYSHIHIMNRNSPHTRSFRRTHVSVVRYRWNENGSTSPKSFRAVHCLQPCHSCFFITLRPTVESCSHVDDESLMQDVVAHKQNLPSGSLTVELWCSYRTFAASFQSQLRYE